MAGDQVVHVRIPEGVGATPDDVEMLAGIFDAIVTLRFGHGSKGAEAEQSLAAEGWSVRSHLKWVAEARRGGELDEATGGSRDEALRHLQELVKADQVLSAP